VGASPKFQIFASFSMTFMMGWGDVLSLSHEKLDGLPRPVVVVQSSLCMQPGALVTVRSANRSLLQKGW